MKWFIFLIFDVDTIGSQENINNRRAIDKEKDSVEIRSNESDFDTDGQLLVGSSVADATRKICVNSCVIRNKLHILFLFKVSKGSSNLKTTNEDQVERTAKSEIDGIMEQLKPKKSNIKYPVLPPRASVNQAMTLQIETNNLLKHIISQNNKQIQLLNELVEIFSNKNE